VDERQQPRPALAGCCFVCDCERIRVAAGPAPKVREGRHMSAASLCFVAAGFAPDAPAS
jgi:hypothetical protein